MTPRAALEAQGWPPAVLDAFKWDPAPLASAKVPRMSEAAFQEKVVELATLMSWRTMHVYPLRAAKGVRTPTTSVGWPDLVMVRAHRMVAAELKAEAGRLTLAQQGWLDALSQVAGIEVYTWRPSDWDRVMQVLGNRCG